MDYLHFFGSIASLICLGIILWRFIKEKKISFQTLYMLTIVLIQAISVGYGIWTRKDLIYIIVGCLFLIFTILSWLAMYLFEKLHDLLQAQQDFIETQTKLNLSERKIRNEIDEDLGHLSKLFGESLEIIKDVIKAVTIESVNTNVKTEQLTDKLKQIEKKIETVHEKTDATRAISNSPANDGSLPQPCEKEV